MARWESEPRRIYGGSPWTRTAIANLDEEEVAAIHDALPEDMYAVLGAERRPGQWVIHLIRGAEAVFRLDGVRNIPNGVRTAVNRWREGQ